MARKIIMECLVIVLVLSLAFASVYSAEADSGAHGDSADDLGNLYRSGLDNISQDDSSLFLFHFDTAVHV